MGQRSPLQARADQLVIKTTASNGQSHRAVEENSSCVDKGVDSQEHAEQRPTPAISNGNADSAVTQKDKHHDESVATPDKPIPTPKRPAGDLDWESAAAFFATSDTPLTSQAKRGRYSDSENYLLDVVHRKLVNDPDHQRRTTWCQKLARHLHRPLDGIKEKLRLRDRLRNLQQCQNFHEHASSSKGGGMKSAATVEPAASLPSNTPVEQGGAGLFDEVTSAVVGELSTLEDDGVSERGELPGSKFAMNDID
jgi:hypothetical protein